MAGDRSRGHRELPDTGAQLPSWSEFVERPVSEFEPRAPAEELAIALRRARTDMEAAVRAGSDSRLRGFHALAEQAVLAVEFENVLARHDTAEALQGLLATLEHLKEKMLAHIAASGLEVVRLRDASAAAVRDIVEVDSWRYDRAYASAVVAEELEIAVRLGGVPIRKGRVVMGAPHDVCPHEWRSEVPPSRTVSSSSGASSGVGPIVCPVADCGTENDLDAEVCIGCLTPLAGYIRLLLCPHVYFNRGLRAGRAGACGDARDWLAAAVRWKPDDLGARSAYALACLQSHDRAAARRAWEEVLERAPGDELAARGLAILATAPTNADEA